MPVTAKLSKLFYDRLGEAIANELVEWFNQVDATYKSDLRDLNEANYARFEAKLEQRIAELRGELKADIASVRSDLVGIEARLEARIDVSVERTHARMEAAFRDHTRFFFVAWAALLIPIIGLWFR